MTTSAQVSEVMNVNLDDFRYVVSIADNQSFTKAAEALFISQSSLSHRIKAIEKEFGIRIFSRSTTRGVYPTEEGKFFISCAREILAAEHKLTVGLEDMRDPDTKSLRIGTARLISPEFMEAFLNDFYVDHKDVRISLQEFRGIDLNKMLVSNQLDVAITYDFMITSTMKHTSFFKDMFVLVPAKGGELEKKLREDGFIPGDVIGKQYLNIGPFAMAEKEMYLYKAMDYILGELDVHPYVNNYGRHMSDLYVLAKAGVASTLLYERLFNLGDRNYPYYYIEDMPVTMGVELVWNKNAYIKEITREFVRYARKFVKKNYQQ